MTSPGSDPTGLLLAEDAVIVLDVDDTLYLEATYVRSGFEAVGQHLAAAHGVAGASAKLWDDFVAGVRGSAFDRVLVANGVEPDHGLIAELVEVYRTHRPAIGLTPDAEAFLRWLDGRPAAAITDGPAESQRAKIEALGLDRFLDPIIVTAELGAGMSKPHHRAFEMIEDAFGALPSHCRYLADNPAKDFVAPLARGWGAIRVRRPSGLHFRVPTPPGVAEVGSLVGLLPSPGLTDGWLQRPALITSSLEA